MLSSELYRIICAYLNRSTLRALKRTSICLRTVVDLYLLSKVIDKPYFANMNKSDCLRYLEQSRIVSEDGTLISDPEVIPLQIYYFDGEKQNISFIDIDYNIYIDNVLIPNIRGKSLARSADLFDSDGYTYFIEGWDGLFYVHHKNHSLTLSLRQMSELYALDHQGKVCRFDEDDPNLLLHELSSKVTLPAFVDLTAVAFIQNDHFLRFLVYLKDEKDQHWLMLEDEYRMWTLSQIVREKKILQIETCNETDEGKCFFNVLFEDGSVEPMMVMIDEDDLLTMFFRDIEHHGLVFSELRGDFLYDVQGKEYCINEDKVEATGFAKWHSRCDWCMIWY